MPEITKPFSFSQGNSPLLVSMPHSGIWLLDGMLSRLTASAKHLPDTDWYLPELYSFLREMDVSTICANYSRYVVDLNRPVDDRPLYETKTTGLFPDILFSEEPIFLKGQQHSEWEKEQIKKQIWRPYHLKIADELARLKDKFGYAILFEAHSIAPEVPMLFNGTLPDFNFGNNGGLSCSPLIIEALMAAVNESRFSLVSNGRFKGGYITRAFGQPDQKVHTVQLELSQAVYLKSDFSGYELCSEKLNEIQPLLKTLINSLLSSGENLCAAEIQEVKNND